jgi:hypothetical protein
LQEYFQQAISGPQIGGSGVLQKLADLASACVDGSNPAHDAVAFSLSVIFALHAEDRADRRVTATDTYQLIAAGHDDLSQAIEFIESGGNNPSDAVIIIASLARITPERLNNRWPPRDAD